MRTLSESAIVRFQICEPEPLLFENKPASPRTWPRASHGFYAEHLAVESISGAAVRIWSRDSFLPSPAFSTQRE